MTLRDGKIVYELNGLSRPDGHAAQGLSVHGQSPLGRQPELQRRPDGLLPNEAQRPSSIETIAPQCHHSDSIPVTSEADNESSRPSVGPSSALAGLPGRAIRSVSPPCRAEEPAKGRDVIQELGVRSFINAAGTFTALTGSLMRPEVVAAMQVASRKYVQLEDLHDAVGKRIAELLNCPAALVTAGCASALSLATAACVAGKDPDAIRRLAGHHAA